MIERGAKLAVHGPASCLARDVRSWSRMSTRIGLGFVFLGSILSSVVMAACSTVLVSSSTEPRKAGVACAFNKQCVSGRCSADVPGGGCGACLDVRKLGESCGGPDQTCNESAVCEKGVCKSKWRVLGESCRIEAKGGDPCDDELYCDGPPGQQGTCAAPIAAGGSCEPPSSKCVKGAYCDESGVCAVPPADSCVLRPCGAGSFCDDHKTCRRGTLKAGERCGIVDGEPVDNGCEPGTACGTTKSPSTAGGPGSIDTCLLLPSEGQICLRNHCAAGLFCAQQTTDSIGVIPPRCEALRQEGDACDTSTSFHIDCGAGLECRHRVCERACD
jgi:hypothetical protein